MLLNIMKTLGVRMYSGFFDLGLVNIFVDYKDQVFVWKARKPIPKVFTKVNKAFVAMTKEDIYLGKDLKLVS